MKKFFYLITLVALTAGVVSCRAERNNEEVDNHSEGLQEEIITVDNDSVAIVEEEVAAEDYEL